MVLWIMMLAVMTITLISTVIVDFVLQFLDVLGLVDGSFMFAPETELSMASDDRLVGPMEFIVGVILRLIPPVNGPVDGLVDVLLDASVCSGISTEAMIHRGYQHDRAESLWSRERMRKHWHGSILRE
jgi:hypothetical protein